MDNFGQELAVRHNILYSVLRDWATADMQANNVRDPGGLAKQESEVMRSRIRHVGYDFEKGVCISCP